MTTTIESARHNLEAADIDNRPASVTIYVRGTEVTATKIDPLSYRVVKNGLVIGSFDFDPFDNCWAVFSGMATPLGSRSADHGIELLTALVARAGEGKPELQGEAIPEPPADFVRRDIDRWVRDENGNEYFHRN